MISVSQNESGVTDGEEEFIAHTPQPQTPGSNQANVDSETDDTYDGSEPPRNFRLISDIYNETVETELIEVLLLAGVDEPTSYEHEVREDAWKVAMDEEIKATERKNTWTLTDLPSGHKAINLIWVYKLKRYTKGTLIKHKARLWRKDMCRSMESNLSRFCPCYKAGDCETLVGSCSQK